MLKVSNSSVSYKKK